MSKDRAAPRRVAGCRKLTRATANPAPSSSARDGRVIFANRERDQPLSKWICQEARDVAGRPGLRNEDVQAGEDRSRGNEPRAETGDAEIARELIVAELRR